MTVAEQIARWKGAHATAIRARRGRDVSTALSSLTDARDALIAAYDLNPELDDVAWNGIVNHAGAPVSLVDLWDFYERQLGPAPSLPKSPFQPDDEREALVKLKSQAELGPILIKDRGGIRTP